MNIIFIYYIISDYISIIRIKMDAFIFKWKLNLNTDVIFIYDY